MNKRILVLGGRFGRGYQRVAEHLGRAGLGHIPEVADGDSPSGPHGRPFEASSLGEFVRLERTVLASRKRPSRRRAEEPQ